MPMITAGTDQSKSFLNATPDYLSFFEVISQVVEKLVKHFKPWEITESNRWKMLSATLHNSSSLHENQFTPPVPENAEAVVCTGGETAETKPLASLQVS